MKAIFELYRKYPAYLLLSLAALISSIGTGLTQVAVYGKLAKQGASPSLFTLAFCLSVVPALFSSRFATRAVRRFKLSRLLAISAVLGAGGLLLPLAGLRGGNLILLLSAEFIGACVSAFNFPVIQILIKRHFEGELLATALQLDSAFFSVQVILGIGIGALLYDHFTPERYLQLDLLSYLIAALVFSLLPAFGRLQLQPESSSDRTETGGVRTVFFGDWSSWSRAQQGAFLLLPALSLVGTPAMALLPTLGSRFTPEVWIHGFRFTPALLFLLAKCLGQMIGPFLVKRSSYTSLSQNESIVWKFLTAFTLLYLMAILIPNLGGDLALILAAHICSNFIYALSIYRVQTSFKIQEISTVSSRIYQIQLVLMTAVSLVSGPMAEWISTPILLLAFLILARFLYSSLRSEKAVFA